MAKEDEELVRAAQQGAKPEARKAFATLVDRWQGPVYRIVRRRVRDHHDSEDLAAMVFVQAWRGLSTLRDPAAFPDWLLQIAVRASLNHLESAGVRHRPDPIEQALLEEEPARRGPEIRDDVTQALGALRPDTLALLREKYEAGLSYAELGRRHGVAVSTIRDRLAQARSEMEGVLLRKGLLEEFGRRALERREERERNGRGAVGNGGGSDG